MNLVHAQKDVDLRMFELPDDQAEVRTTALMMEGTTLIPASRAAITKGDWEAVPVDPSKCSLADDTIRPTMKIVIT